MSDKTEEQRVEEIKELWRKYGTYLIALLILGVGSIFGVRGWLAHQETTLVSGSSQYQAALNQGNRGEYSSALEELAGLRTNHADSPYATLGALLAARLELDNGNLGGAQTQLEWAASHGSDRELRDLARVNLARLQRDNGDHEAALATLSGQESDAFAAFIAEVRGDILHARGDAEGARNAWTIALDAMPSQELRDILQLKHDNL